MYNKRQRDHYIMIIGSIHQETILIITIYALIIGAPKNIKLIPKNLTGKVDNNNSRGAFNIPIPTMHKLSSKKINKQTLDLRYTLCKMDLVDKCRRFHSQSIRIQFFSSGHETFSRTDYMLGHKLILTNVKRLK